MVWKKQSLKRAYSCNTEVLLFFREQRGWTQGELATVSGYSERLISKAESGQSISSTTINDLAESLSSPETPVHPEDLISDPLSMAKEYIAALYQHQQKPFEIIRNFLDEEVVFQVSGDPDQIPFAGEHRGIQAIEKMLDTFFSILEAPQNHDHIPCYKFLSEGNDVMVIGECWIHPIGRPLNTPIKLTNHLVFQRGKLILLEDIFDTLEGIKALNEGDA